MQDKNTYKLLTPGPLTTTATVKDAMQVDLCPWDDDYKQMTQDIHQSLLKLAHADNGGYTTVLMQGSGTFGVETSYDKVPDAAAIDQALTEHPEVTHVSMVHSETTTGILNDIATVGTVAKKHGVQFIVDAMSTFGGVDIDVPALGITCIISSANKCIQGVPGFSFIIAKKENLANTKGTARSLALDLFAQWDTIEKDSEK